MTKNKASRTTATHDRRLRALESELEKVTARFRVAKLHAREAKAAAKAVKKEMKHARSALIAAQEEHEQKSRRTTSSGRAGAKAKEVTNAAPKRKIADSPERVRQPPRKRRSASVAVSTPAPPRPDLATPASELLESDAHREPHPDDADSEPANASR